jgi:hypothetical protein
MIDWNHNEVPLELKDKLLAKIREATQKDQHSTEIPLEVVFPLGPPATYFETLKVFVAKLVSKPGGIADLLNEALGTTGDAVLKEHDLVISLGYDRWGKLPLKLVVYNRSKKSSNTGRK